MAEPSVNGALGRVLARLQGTVRNGMTRCPAHEDREASLSIKNGDGKVLLYCHAGCTLEQVLAALDLQKRDLFDESPVAAVDRRQIIARYDYRDEQGTILHRTVRYSPKGFSQCHPDGRGGWIWNLKDTRLIPYRLNEWHDSQRPIFIVEGEKDADRLYQEDVLATTFPMGAGKWRSEYARYFVGRAVTIIADRDKSGRSHAAEVARALEGVASTISCWESREGKDISDHLAAGIPLQECLETSVDAWEYAIVEEAQEAIEEATGPTVTIEASDVQYLDLERIAREGIPALNWLLPGWIVTKDVGLFAGGGGIGKSTTAAALALALAHGHAWCSLIPTRPLRVLYYDEEQDEDTTARLFLRLGKPTPNLKVASGQGIRLDAPEGAARLEREIASFRPDIVFLDSVQQAFGKAKENDATEIGNVYATMFRLRDQYATGFLLLHHKRKTQPGQGQIEALELVRGSTAHGTQASTVWYAYAGSEANTLNLTQAKRRGAPKQSLRILYSEDGDQIQLESAGPIDDTDTALAKAQEWIHDYLSERTSARWGDLKDAGEAAGHTEATLKRARELMLKTEAIFRPQRGHYRIGSSHEPKDEPNEPTAGQDNFL